MSNKEILPKVPVLIRKPSVEEMSEGLSTPEDVDKYMDEIYKRVAIELNIKETD